MLPPRSAAGMHNYKQWVWWVEALKPKACSFCAKREGLTCRPSPSFDEMAHLHLNLNRNRCHKPDLWEFLIKMSQWSCIEELVWIINYFVEARQSRKKNYCRPQRWHNKVSTKENFACYLMSGVPALTAMSPSLPRSGLPPTWWNTLQPILKSTPSIIKAAPSAPANERETWTASLAEMAIRHVWTGRPITAPITLRFSSLESGKKEKQCPFDYVRLGPHVFPIVTYDIPVTQFSQPCPVRLAEWRPHIAEP